MSTADDLDAMRAAVVAAVQDAGVAALRDAVVATAAEQALPEQTGEWWRQAGPRLVCQCGASLYHHRLDTKGLGRDQGDCPGFLPVELVWVEQRVVHQPVRWPA